MNLKSLIAISAALCATAFVSTASAQGTLQIGNGTPCTYTAYTQTVSSTGLPNFVFTASGCAGGGAPSSGNIRLSASTYPAIDVSTGTRVVNVERSGATAGNGSQTVNIGASPAGTCSISPASLTWNDGENATKSATVTAGATPGTCTVQISGLSNVAAPDTATIAVTSPSAPGAVGFTSASQTVTVGAPITIAVARSGAGSTAPSSDVTFSCNVAGGTGGTVATASPMTFANNGSQNISITGTTAAGSISCTISGATNGVTLGSTTHTVTVQAVAAPVCQAPVANPSSIPATGGTSNLTVSCTNSPTSYTWAAAGANAGSAPPITGSTASATVNVAANHAAGTYTYQVTATNAGGSTTQQASVTVNAAVANNCVIKDRQADYPAWNAGNAYNTSGSPQIVQARTETYAFRLRLSEIFNPNVANARGDFQIDEPLAGIYHTISITAQPCVFTETINTAAAQCQTTGNTGRFGQTFVRNTDVRSNSFLSSYGICRLPDLGGQDFVYANVRFAGPTGIEPQTITCPNNACTYFPLYQKID